MTAGHDPHQEAVPEQSRRTRRQVLGGLSFGLLGMTLPDLLRVRSSSGGERNWPSQVVHLPLPQRRSQPHRHVGHEAQCTGGGPG